jgi:hypothetical protein
MRETAGASIFGNAFWTLVSIAFLVYTIATGTGDGDGVSFWTWIGLFIWSGLFAYYLQRTVFAIFTYRELKKLVDK